MKKQLTSFDLYVLAGELNDMLENARVNKTYQIAERGLKIKLHTSGGSRDLIITPDYVCVSKYSRSVPMQPTSFAMQLRKHLEGGFIRKILMHEFDRIVEFEIEKACKWTLIFELFGKGNVILCDSQRRITGLLESRKWKDRDLWAGREYKYPPSGANPLEIDRERFIKILKSSEKDLVRTLASDVGLGGFYAEELCLSANLDKNLNSGGLGDREVELLYDVFYNLIDYFKQGKNKNFKIVYKGGEAMDVLPFESGTYSSQGFTCKEFESFNDAVDEYFGEGVVKKSLGRGEEKYNQELKRLTGIEAKQKETIENLSSEAVRCQEVGNLIYQNLNAVEGVIAEVRKKRKSMSDEEIVKKINGVRGIKGNDLELEL